MGANFVWDLSQQLQCIVFSLILIGSCRDRLDQLHIGVYGFASPDSDVAQIGTYLTLIGNCVHEVSRDVAPQLLDTCPGTGTQQQILDAWAGIKQSVPAGSLLPSMNSQVGPLAIRINRSAFEIFEGRGFLLAPRFEAPFQGFFLRWVQCYLRLIKQAQLHFFILPFPHRLRAWPEGSLFKAGTFRLNPFGVIKLWLIGLGISDCFPSLTLSIPYLLVYQVLLLIPYQGLQLVSSLLYSPLSLGGKLGRTSPRIISSKVLSSSFSRGKTATRDSSYS